MNLVIYLVFALAAPPLWNTLLQSLREEKSVHIFKKHLKRHLFSLDFLNLNIAINFLICKNGFLVFIYFCLMFTPPLSLLSLVKTLLIFCFSSSTLFLLSVPFYIITE